MADSYSLLVSASCATSLTGSGVLTVQMDYVASGSGSPEQPTMLYLLDGGGSVLRSQGGSRNSSADFTGLGNGTYGARWEDSGTGAVLATGGLTLTCPAGGVGSLVLDSLTHTNETAGGANDGTATIQGSGGTDPLTALVVETGDTQPTTNGAPVTFTGLAPGSYTVRLTDINSQQVEGMVEVAAYIEAVSGCRDEYATDYSPAAAVNGSCSYSVNWRSAWAPGRMPVRVPALAGQTAAYTTARLRIGFRPGHPLAADRPLGAPLELTATVGPDGYATFRLGHYLRSALGADDGEAGRRLDLNSPTALTSDLFVGYELRRPTGQLLDHGYALNAAVPDEQLSTGLLLSPFGNVLPVWPGYDEYLLPTLNDAALGKFAELTTEHVYQYDNKRLPCPTNPLPVAWLAPGGGYGYWVFQGRPTFGDEVEEGSRYQEPESGERRYSSRGDARRTITASSGVFKGAELMEGLRTLWRSPQVWYMPKPGGPWVPVTLEAGSFPAGRSGVARQQVSISFTHAAPEWAQGQ